MVPLFDVVLSLYRGTYIGGLWFKFLAQPWSLSLLRTIIAYMITCEN